MSSFTLRRPVALLALAIATTASTTALGISTAPEAQAADACSVLTAPIYHRDNPGSNTSLLTPWKSEYDKAGTVYNFTQDYGYKVKAATSPVTGSVPIHRVYRSSPSDFMYVTEGVALDAALSAKYVDQGINFYAFPTAGAPSCSTSVVTYTRSGQHRYAMTSAEATALETAGWVVQGDAFRAAPLTSAPSSTPAETKFTFAEMADTQAETSPGNNTVFANRTAWLAANKVSLNLKFVGHDGDVVNWGWLVPSQYAVASDAMKNLEAAGIPYAMAIGNHDTRAVGHDGITGSRGYGGSAYVNNPECVERLGAAACDTRLLVRQTQEFNAVFTAQRETSVAGQFETGKVDNEFSTFTAGGKKFLVLTLEFSPRAEVVNWARQVVASHPDFNVIVQTHYYLTATGGIGQDNQGYGSTTPQYLYDNLIKVYPNIKVVFSGHVGTAASRVDTGVNGNKIVSMMQTMHAGGSTNPVRLTEFDLASGSLSTRIYAPATNQTWSEYTATFTGLTFV